MVDNFLKKELDINQVEVTDEDAPQQIVDENLINQNDPISRGDYLLGYVSLEANLSQKNKENIYPIENDSLKNINNEDIGKNISEVVDSLLEIKKAEEELKEKELKELKEKISNSSYPPITPNLIHPDAVIIGAGPVGCWTAMQLRAKGFNGKITLYEKYKDSDYLRAELSIPKYLNFPTLLTIICLMSFFFHPGTKNKYYLSLQMLVSLNIYSECIGLIPQLYLIYKTKETGNVSEYYILFLGIARFFRLIFWFKMYIDGNSFMSLIFADLTHTVLLSVFIYTFKSNLSTFSMPTFSSDDSKPRKKIF